MRVIRARECNSTQQQHWQQKKDSRQHGNDRNSYNSVSNIILSSFSTTNRAKNRFPRTWQLTFFSRPAAIAAWANRNRSTATAEANSLTDRHNGSKINTGSPRSDDSGNRPTASETAIAADSDRSGSDKSNTSRQLKQQRKHYRPIATEFTAAVLVVGGRVSILLIAGVVGVVDNVGLPAINLVLLYFTEQPRGIKFSYYICS